MPAIRQNLELDGVPLARLESDFLRVDVAPEIGGRIVSLIHQPSGHQFLWRNSKLPLKRLEPGSEYDPNFYGAIDELLPNDMPEQINGIDCPDHGELWTTPLACRIDGERVLLQGNLPQFGLLYEREMSLRANAPCLDFKYRISNTTRGTRQFLWKLHAALALQREDVIDCPARKAQVVDRAWSRFSSLAPFDWPVIEGQSANIVPQANGTMDFFYLFDLSQGEMAWVRPSRNLKFYYRFEKRIFPFAWLFASYGGFNGHYTVILEPCTAMPMSVNQAAAQSQCSRLEPGQTLETTVTIYAGPLDEKSAGFKK